MRSEGGEREEGGSWEVRREREEGGSWEVRRERREGVGR